MCWGSGSPFREFSNAEDLGEACVLVLENWSALLNNAPKDDAGKPLPFLNVGTGVDLSIRGLAQQIAAVVGFMALKDAYLDCQKALDEGRLRSWAAILMGCHPDGLNLRWRDHV